MVTKIDKKFSNMAMHENNECLQSNQRKQLLWVKKYIIGFVRNIDFIKITRMKVEWHNLKIINQVFSKPQVQRTLNIKLKIILIERRPFTNTSLRQIFRLLSQFISLAISKQYNWDVYKNWILTAFKNLTRVK